MNLRFHHVRHDQQSLRRLLGYALHVEQIELHKKSNTVPNVQAATICILEDDNRKKLATGFAFCSSKDQFNRATGRKISQGRAMKQLEEK